MNRSSLTRLIQDWALCTFDCRLRQALLTNVIPPGDVYWDKAQCCWDRAQCDWHWRTLEGFLISLWFELRDLRSLDPQVDNISRQSRGTVQQWKGTAHLHASGALPKSFSMSKNVTTPLVAITALGLGHLLRPLASNRCPWALSLHPFRPRWPSLSSHYTSVDYPIISLYQYIPVGLTQFDKARGFNR